MTTITEWQGAIGLADYTDNRLGLAGSLFKACLKLSVELVKGPAKENVGPDAFQCLRAQTQRFSLWGDGLGANDGELDEILTDSDHLKKVDLSFLSAFGDTLEALADKFPVNPLSSRISDNCRQLEVLQEQAAKVTSESQDDLNDDGRASDTKLKSKSSPSKEFREIAPTSPALDGSGRVLDWKPFSTCGQVDVLQKQSEIVSTSGDSGKFSDSRTSSTQDDIEDLIEDLKMFNDCFMDLVPTLENPAKNFQLEEKAPSLQGTHVSVMEAAHSYIANIQDKFPSIDENFAQRLGEANWQRHERLRKKLASALQEEIEPQSATSDEEEFDTGYVDQTAHMPVQSETTKSSYSGPSIWDNNSTGRLNYAYKVPVPSAAPSMTSFASSVGNVDLDKTRRHVPKLPNDHDWGSIFRCPVCGDTVRNINNRADWKKHVFDDLEPYICSFLRCSNGINTFASRRAWIDHEFSKHRVKVWPCTPCSMTFGRAVDFREHVKQTHSTLLTSSQVEDAVRAETTRMLYQPNAKQMCPFCLAVPAESKHTFAAHVGEHMQEVALAALPPSTASDLDDASFGTDQSQGSEDDELPVFSHMTAKKREEIHRWLSAPDPSLNHVWAKEKRVPSTGSWFLMSEQFADWKTNPHSLLWIYGIPGCGKTILCSTIIENVLCQCQHDPAMAVAYFYFDFNDNEKQQYDKMIRSLITQLSMQCKSMPEALESLFSSHRKNGQQPVVSALLATLQQVFQEFRETFIILDALDECTEKDELLSLIEGLPQRNMGELHILVASRREFEFEEGLRPLVTHQVCIQDALIRADIDLLIREHLQNDSRLKRWPVNLRKEIEETLINQAHGMFLWVVCQLNMLRKCQTPIAAQRALKTLPTSLDATYDRILMNIDNEFSKEVFMVLHWLAFSARPVRLEEVAEVFAIDLNGHPRFRSDSRLLDPQGLPEICSALVTVSSVTVEGQRGGIEELKFVHYSVKEYLVSKQIQHGPAARFSIQEISAHKLIAECCLAYLLQFDKSRPLTTQTNEEFPLARYAAEYWTHHTRLAGKNSRTANMLIMELFSPKIDAFINWIRLFDPDKPWKEPDITKRLESVAYPLYYVSMAGLIESVRVLLEQGADVNAQGGRYGNALQAASYSGHDEIVQQLLEKGAHVNARGGEYGSALQAASYSGHDKIVQQLLEKGANMGAQGGKYGNALQAASEHGHEGVVRLLLEKKPKHNLTP
ncbi:MAG: hypothetical protein M1830_000071 [Pleopsidium flavum]|nr:MAG: hypothetical protein M1830_000071 [Pleopsidium flavum]